MKYIYLANNRVGLEVLQWLVAQGYPPTGLVIHADDRGKYRDEIITASNLPPDKVFDGSTLQSIETFERMALLKPALGLSVFFDYILRQRVLSLFPEGCINLHPSFLPFNRGQYPNVWSIVEGTPSGVTLHYIDEKIDTGDIVAQREVPIDDTDTGESLYRKLEKACVDLFCDTWPLIVDGSASRFPQKKDGGTYHKAKDVQMIDEIDLEQQYKARDLINILRARTFRPYKGAYFISNGRRVYMSLALYSEERK